MGAASFDLRILMARADSDVSGAARHACFDATRRILEHDTALSVQTGTFWGEQRVGCRFARLSSTVMVMDGGVMSKNSMQPCA